MIRSHTSLPWSSSGKVPGVKTASSGRAATACWKTMLQQHNCRK